MLSARHDGAGHDRGEYRPAAVPGAVRAAGRGFGGGAFWPTPRATTPTERRIDARARTLVEAIRAKAGGLGGLGGIEDFLHAYSLSTKEGLALMVLAEALLRVPDAATADRLIEDKLAAGRWLDGDINSHGASGLGFGLDARRSPRASSIRARRRRRSSTRSSRRLGLPAMRAATRQAMRLIGSHFVLGQTIEEALARARGHAEFRYSFDMLGEGARTADDADNYFDAYAGAIAAIGRAPATRRRLAGGASGHLGQALGAASALRGDLARAGAGGTGAAPDRARAHGQGARPALHHRCRRSRPAGTVARRHRRRCSPIPRCAAGTASGLRCRPIRSAPWR